MTIAGVAANGEEQIALAQGARIDRDAIGFARETAAHPGAKRANQRQP